MPSSTLCTPPYTKKRRGEVISNFCFLSGPSFKVFEASLNIKYIYYFITKSYSSDYTTNPNLKI